MDIAESLRHFPLSTAMNAVESEVWTNLESVEHNYLKSRKSGVNTALRLVDNSIPSYWIGPETKVL